MMTKQGSENVENVELKPVVIVSVGTALSGELREGSAEFGWRTVEAAQPAQALRLIRQARPAVVVVELRPGAPAGGMLIRLLSHPGRNASVVAVSASHSDGLEREAREMGASSYVPFANSIAPIAEAVNHILDRTGRLPRQPGETVRSMRKLSSFPPPRYPTGGGRETDPPPVPRRRGFEPGGIRSE